MGGADPKWLPQNHCRGRQSWHPEEPCAMVATTAKAMCLKISKANQISSGQFFWEKIPPSFTHFLHSAGTLWGPHTKQYLEQLSPLPPSSATHIFPFKKIGNARDWDWETLEWQSLLHVLELCLFPFYKHWPSITTKNDSCWALQQYKGWRTAPAHPLQVQCQSIEKKQWHCLNRHSSIDSSACNSEVGTGMNRPMNLNSWWRLHGW